MKQLVHFFIGASSGALIFLTSLSLSVETAILFIGIGIGSVIPDIDGNVPRKYHNNPLLLWLAYFNYLVLYPVLKLIFHKKELKKRDLSNIFAIIILAFIFYVILRIVDIIINTQFHIDQLVIGILIGGIFTIIAHSGTKEGAVPLYPLWKKKIKGNVNPWSGNEKRPMLLIFIPLIVIGLEIVSGFGFPRIILPATDFNLLVLIFLWTGYLYSAHIFSLKGIIQSQRPSRRHFQRSTSSRPRFHSNVEKYNFGELNKERKKRGLGMLQFDNSYADMSRHHSQRMATSGNIFHGNNVNQTHGSYSGENCALMFRGRVRGFHHMILTDRDVAKALHRNWMNSPGHRENILNPGFNTVGIGIYRSGRSYYATQLFSN